MNRPRYQLGTLYSEPRKSGPDVWVYRWRETDEQGRRTLRKQIIGTVRELRTQADAQRAAETLRLSINRHTIDRGGSVVTVHHLVAHYRMKEMPMDTHEGKTRATKLAYQNCLKLYIVPRWGDYPLRRVTSVEVEDWLKTLKLAASTRAKIRNLMSTLFRHAIRWGFLGQQENPIALVRVKAGRKRVPDTLTGEEFRALMAVLPDRERVMGGICATTGLRVCEVLGLKWEDIDFARKTANVLRSYVSGSIGPCKTEVSQQPVPLDAITLQRLIAWRGLCAFGADTDWIFASERLFGKLPVWPDILRSKILQPAAKRAGITKRIGWHTFRHTYSSLLAATGSDVKVVQELMRHAKVSTTMEVYTHAAMDKKRIAQSRAVDVLFNRTSQNGNG